MATSTRSRLSPEARRAQLIEIGLELLASRTSLDDLSMDEVAAAANISKGLVFHYFGSKRDYQLAVAHAATDEFFRDPDPDPSSDLDGQLQQSVEAFVSHVAQNRDVYVNLVRGTASGDEAMRELFAATRDRFVGRILDRLGMIDDPSSLLLLAVRGWVALAEEITVTWADDMAPDQATLIRLLRDSLAQVVLLALTDAAEPVPLPPSLGSS